MRWQLCSIRLLTSVLFSFSSFLSIATTSKFYFVVQLNLGVDAQHQTFAPYQAVGIQSPEIFPLLYCNFHPSIKWSSILGDRNHLYWVLTACLYCPPPVVNDCFKTEGSFYFVSSIPNNQINLMQMQNYNHWLNKGKCQDFLYLVLGYSTIAITLVCFFCHVRGSLKKNPPQKRK